MRTERSSSSSRTLATREANRDRDRPRRIEPHERQAFEAIYARTQRRDQEPEHAAVANDRDDRDADRLARDRPDGLAAWQQRMQIDAQRPQSPTLPPAPSMPARLAELIERHLKQLLISAPATDATGRREVMLRMSDSVFPDTDLWLSATSEGWRLRVDARSALSRDLVDAVGAQLVERFASAGLGALAIDAIEPHAAEKRSGS
jgi:hypothetical protein